MENIESCLEDGIKKIKYNSILLNGKKYYNYMHFYPQNFDNNKVFCLSNLEQLLFCKANEQTTMIDESKIKLISPSEYRFFLDDYRSCLKISREYWKNDLVKQTSKYQKLKEELKEKEMPTDTKRIICHGVMLVIAIVAGVTFARVIHNQIEADNFARLVTTAGGFIGATLTAGIIEEIFYFATIDPDKKQKDISEILEKFKITQNDLGFSLYKNILLNYATNGKVSPNDQELSKQLQKLPFDNYGVCKLVRERK